MNLDIRHNLMKNLDEAHFDEINETILDAVESGSDETLPGMGVMFEILWKASDETQRAAMVARIVESLKTKAH